MRSIPLIGLLFSVAVFVVAQPAPDEQTAVTAQSLTAGTWILEPKEGSRRFTIELDAGDFLELEVEQLGVDLVVTLTEPDAETAKLSRDGPYAERERERLLAIARASGPHTVEVGWGTAEPGAAFRLETPVRRAATPKDHRRVEAARIYDRGETARRAKNFSQALALYTEAARRWDAADDVRGEALAWHRVGQIHEGLEEPALALDAYRHAHDLAVRTGSAVQEADLLYDQGKLFFQKLDYDAADAAFGESAEIYTELGDLHRQSRSVNRIAWIHERRGDLDAAFEIYSRALELARKSGDRHRHLELQGSILNNLGETDLRLGRPAVALERFHGALRLRQKTNDRIGMAITLTSLGTALRRLDRLEEAHEYFVKAWQIQRHLGDEHADKLANTLIGLGLTELAQGEPQRAERAFETAAEQARRADSRRNEAMALVGWTEALEAQGNHDRAIATCRKALGALVELEDLQGQASAAFVIARNERARGRLQAAHSWLEVAIERTEEIRRQTEPEALRLTYFDAKHLYHRTLVDLLMELHVAEPEADWDVRALGASERSRARTLLDAVRISVAEGPDLPIPELSKIQDELLDGDTLLLEFSLGEARSHLFAITSEGFQTHVLPPRATLERLAEQAHQALVHRHSGSARLQAKLTLEALSRQIFGPVADELGNRRLVIVADGRLHAVPFAALPDPRSLNGPEPVPLLVEHEVVHVPSLAVVDAGAERPRAWTATLAVVADPVFRGDDPRLPTPKSAVPSPPQAPSSRGGEHPPVPFTAREAELLLNLVPAEERRAALGFDAHLGLLDGDFLASSRILHIATHGVLDEEHPERSHLILSLFDAEGRPREGRLRAPQIAELNLASDLVVLSACRTGLGQNVRGEGLMSLSRVFLLAGASRVVVSLWQVDDRVTAELMAHFYRGLLTDGLSPAAALRRAQLAIRAEEGTSAPYFWAPFILQGDWRPAP